MAALPLRTYTKKELRALLYNPQIDFNNPTWELNARLVRREKLNEIVKPVIESKCKHLVTVEEWDRWKVVPPKVIRVLFENLKVELCL